MWYFVTIGALVVGGLFARWLLMQANNPFKRDGPPRRIELPPWFKWVTLTAIIGGSVVVLLGMELFSSGDRDSTEFSLGGAAFLIGIVAAVWVARRFDETESRIRKQRALAQEARRRGPKITD